MFDILVEIESPSVLIKVLLSLSNMSHESEWQWLSCHGWVDVTACVIGWHDKESGIKLCLQLTFVSFHWNFWKLCKSDFSENSFANEFKKFRCILYITHDIYISLFLSYAGSASHSAPRSVPADMPGNVDLIKPSEDDVVNLHRIWSRKRGPEQDFILDNREYFHL